MSSPVEAAPPPAGSAAEPDDAMKAARSPVGTGSAPLFGQLLALVLIALGVVGVEEVLVRTGVIGQPSWTSAALDRLDGLTQAGWLLPVGVLLVLVGLALLLVVLKPRPRKAFTLDAHTGVFLRTADLARVAEGAVEGTEGVTDVSARARRRSLDVTVTTLGQQDGAAVERAVRERLDRVLAPLSSPPRVRVELEAVTL